MSKNMNDFKENLHFFTKEEIEAIQKLKMDQSENEHWFEYRKCSITASTAHEVATKMSKVEKGGGGTINMWSLKQKISGLVFVKANIPALKYGRDMGIDVANAFIEFIKRKHNCIKLSGCGLFVAETLPDVGANPDRTLLCSCCEKTFVEIKCPYSINYTKSCYSNLEYVQLCDRKTLKYCSAFCRWLLLEL